MWCCRHPLSGRSLRETSQGDRLAGSPPQVFVDDLLAHFGKSEIRSAEEAEQPLPLYRSLLESASDHSVTLVAIGHSSNLLELLNDPAHQFGSGAAALSGSELVRVKVAQLVMVGGRHTFAKAEHVPRSSNRITPVWNQASCAFLNV